MERRTNINGTSFEFIPPWSGYTERRSERSLLTDVECYESLRICQSSQIVAWALSLTIKGVRKAV